MKKSTGRSVRRYRKRDYAAFIFISPWIIGFLVFQAYPFLSSFVYSFTDLSMLKPYKFIGLYNFKEIFTHDQTFIQSLKVTVVYVLISVPLKLTFALFIAMLLNLKVKGIGVFKTLYYLPSILGGSVGIAILWRFLFNKNGFINQLIGRLGMPAVDWLGSPDISLITISLLAVWQFGSSMILFLAALKQIPQELYEAAQVDGSGRVRMFFKITVPMITPIILFNIVMQMINAFQEFAAPFLITKGGPLKATYLYGLMLYDNAFTYLKMGYASALSWIMFVIILILTALIFKSSAYWTFYQDGGK
ncbi:carbohydrate ABC transporter permease [Lachnotalea sp. AF33-28]|jgi:oligogalacturonide transport system permease protein|uniref:carbohydrate ABC transporter permease n=1 Tax=Lachnotalea sp. AF33-28 TaxID=2292046 RepID=UPI000E506A9A|nr:sugar ABC transporter permease [Lachnotalea sp. AF33-28]RHP36376.1 sugar ABC transporter permease [Lachnotalea sp. AF33-28]